MNIPKDLILTTERLLLRIPMLEDIPFVYSASQFKGFNDGMLWEPPSSPEELIVPHENIIKAWEKNTAYSFTITNNFNKSLIGRISIRKETEEGVWNIGFWTHPNSQNNGFMTEATKAIIRFGFTQLNANKIIANHALWNKASEKVLQKCGMTFTQYFEQGLLKNGKWIEENQLEIKRQDWEKPIVTSIVINKLNPKNNELIDQIADWYLAQWNIPKERTIQRLGAHPNNDILFQLVLFINDKPIATGGLYNNVSLHNTYPEFKTLSPWVSLLYTENHFRNQGLGAQLLYAIETEAKKLNYSEIFLYTFTAESLYIKNGWIPIERVDYHGKDTVVMRKNL